MRAYTDSVAQALLQAEKIAIVRKVILRCSAPYPLEGLVRREIDAAGAQLLDVAHGDAVVFAFSLPEQSAQSFGARLSEAGHGRIAWLRDDQA